LTGDFKSIGKSSSHSFFFLILLKVSKNIYLKIKLGFAGISDEREHLNRPPESQPTIKVSLSSLFIDIFDTFNL